MQSVLSGLILQASICLDSIGPGAIDLPQVTVQETEAAGSYFNVICRQWVARTHSTFRIRRQSAVARSAMGTSLPEQ